MEELIAEFISKKIDGGDLPEYKIMDDRGLTREEYEGLLLEFVEKYDLRIEQ